MVLFADIDSGLDWKAWLLNGILVFLSLILIFIVLIQRGKGGGLAGAFGGSGGSSAFGSRAGDQFTKIPLYMVAIWVLVIMINVKVMPKRDTVAAAKPSDDAVPTAPNDTPAP